MKIEVGKRYTRGDGSITAKLEKYEPNSTYLFCPYTRNLYVRDTGYRCANYSDSEKLVKEFVEMPQDTLFVKSPTKKYLVGGRDKSTPELNFAYISVVDHQNGDLDIVIGAPYSSRCASSFNKVSLAKLIEELQAIHDVME